MLKHEETYEIMRPEMVGVDRTKLVLGKHSGRHALRARLQELGYELSDEELNRVFKRFKVLADQKTITNADLEALMADEVYQPVEVYALEGLQVTCGTMGMPTATVRLRGPDGATYTEAAVGTGPVHAAYTAIDRIVGQPVTLLEFAVNAVTEGIDALGEVTVRIRYANGHESGVMNPQNETTTARTFGGHGADTDIIVASVKAYLSAVNKMLIATGVAQPASGVAAD